MNFEDLKNRTNSLLKIQEEAAKINTNEDFLVDDTYWQPTRGKDGNGFAIIRFLPASAVDGADGVPFVKYYRHSFRGPVTDEWYIENCLTSIGKKDPVNDFTRLLWKADTEHDKKLAGLYKRRTTYVSNILIIKDDAKPENVGKVKRFRYGVKLWAKIEDALNPKIGTAIDPFDFWKGANFGVVVKTVKEYTNYDDSKFDVPSVLSEDDNYLEKLWRESYSLKELLDEKNYKDYDTLKEKFDSIVGFSYEERGSLVNAVDNSRVLPPAQKKPPLSVTSEKTTTSNIQKVPDEPASDSLPPWATGETVTSTEGLTSNKTNDIPDNDDGDDEDLAFLRKVASSS